MTQKNIILTGIKPTGQPHLGNYFGAIKPALMRSEVNENSFFFIADYHALNTISSADELKKLTHIVAATWIASGLDPSKCHFYKQSDISEIFELETILNSTVPKGWMNKAHAYKAAVDKNRADKKDLDSDVNMGLYNYPILMASDILIFNANKIPVGKDQIQHVEIARDIAMRFNSKYSTSALTLPEYVVEKDIQEIPGIDGRKMSKSYGNVIPLYGTEEDWFNSVRKIVTDSEPNHTTESFKATTFYGIYHHVATNDESEKLCELMVSHKMGWKEAKEDLMDKMIKRLKEPSSVYLDLLHDTRHIDSILDEGAKKISPLAKETLSSVKAAIGVI